MSDRAVQPSLGSEIALNIKYLFSYAAGLLASADRNYRRAGVAASAPVKTKDGRFTYEAAGDPGLPALVFLHGIGGAARTWRRQLDAFGDRHRAMAWDMPGYGGSTPLAGVSIATLADALQDFLQQVGAAKPVLVGHSIGGMI